MMSKYLVKGKAWKLSKDTRFCDCEFCEGHPETESNEFEIETIISALSVDSAMDECLAKEGCEKWIDDPIVEEVSPYEVIRSPEEELDALKAWRANTKTWDNKITV